MWYEVLKVSESASAEEIQIAYNELMGTPIVFNDADKEKEVKKAYL